MEDAAIEPGKKGCARSALAANQEVQILIVVIFHTANKQFDVMYYHDRNHAITGGNPQLHLHTLMTNYFIKNLWTEHYG